MKVSEFLKDSHDPRGSLGLDVDHDVATAIAGQIRQILHLDLEEADIATAAYIYNSELATKQEEFIAAWEFLNPGERRAWREFVRLGKYVD